jgi:hypothetical protein
MATVISEGRAERGWLWAVLILAFLAIAVRLAPRCQLEGS